MLCRCPERLFMCLPGQPEPHSVFTLQAFATWVLGLSVKVHQRVPWWPMSEHCAVFCRESCSSYLPS